MARVTLLHYLRKLYVLILNSPPRPSHRTHPSLLTRSNPHLCEAVNGMREERLKTVGEFRILILKF